MKQQEAVPPCKEFFQAGTEAAAGERFAQLWLGLMTQDAQAPSPAAEEEAP